MPKVSLYQANGLGTPFEESQATSPTLWTSYSNTIVPGDGTLVLKLEQADASCTSPLNFDSVKLTVQTNDITIDHLEQEPEIPRRFHQNIVHKALADFYKDPRHTDFERARFYEMEYERGIKEAKKLSRGQHIETGYIKPVDF